MVWPLTSIRACSGVISRRPADSPDDVVRTTVTVIGFPRLAGSERARAVALMALNTASSVFAVTSTPVVPRKFVSLYCVMPAPSKIRVKAPWRFGSTAPKDGPEPDAEAALSLAEGGSSMRGLFCLM